MVNRVFTGDFNSLWVNNAGHFRIPYRPRWVWFARETRQEENVDETGFDEGIVPVPPSRQAWRREDSDTM